MFPLRANHTFRSDYRWVIDQVIQRSQEAGLQVTRSFDLKVALAAHSDCPCPYHGSEQCDCQMVILLIYGGSGSPATLVIHGHDSQVELSLVDAPELTQEQELVERIIQVFTLLKDSAAELNSYPFTRNKTICSETEP